MNQKIYKFNSDRRTIILTIVHFVTLSLAAVLIWLLYVGGYFSAWFISIVVALIALMALSIPRRIILDSELLTIECLLEIAEIPTKNIVSVRRVEEGQCNWMIPIFGSYGFFGYYGYYLDLSSFERVLFYATERKNLIEIVDCYDDRYYISSRNAEEFIRHLDDCISQQFWHHITD